jgi:hypothetical protein
MQSGLDLNQVAAAAQAAKMTSRGTTDILASEWLAHCALICRKMGGAALQQEAVRNLCRGNFFDRSWLETGRKDRS